jgi:hypothetical protein
MVQSRRSGFSLVAASAALVASALVVSAAFVVLKSKDGGDRSVRVRVDLHLEAVRVLRLVTDILKDAQLVEPGTSEENPRIPRDVVFRRPGEDPDTYSLVVASAAPDSELQLWRADPSGALLGSTVIGRHVEEVAVEAVAGDPPGSGRRRVTVRLRQVVDRQVYTVRLSSDVKVKTP